MRTLLIPLLLASVASSPVLAAQRSSDDRQAAREQAREDRRSARDERRSTRQESRSNREQRGAAVAERQVQPAPDARGPARNRAASGDARTAGAEQRRATLEQRRESARQSVEQRRETIRQRSDGSRATDTQRGADLSQRRQQQKAEIAERRERLKESRELLVSRVPRAGTQPPAPDSVRPTPKPTWHHDWRRDSRYDWWRYRYYNGSLFNLGFYYDPYGWGYQPYMTGWRMWPSYYSSRYWLNDPWTYRLPYAPPGTRWVRYYDDAILVDTWSGQVLDVIYDFFW